MKNYNKILEAINKGIRLALDDYEDIENISDPGLDESEIVIGASPEEEEETEGSEIDESSEGNTLDSDSN